MERRAKGLSANDRRAFRQRESVPVLNALGDWLLHQKRRVLPKSPIGQAISYALGNWQALCRYAKNGELTIDNSLSERALRAHTVGRTNWMFVGSDNRGRTAAVLFNITASCKRHGIDPFRYLVDVLCRLPTTSDDQLPELLPDTWIRANPTRPENGPRDLTWRLGPAML